MPRLRCGLFAPAAVAAVWLTLPIAALPQGSPQRGYLHVVWDGAATPDNPDDRTFYLVREDGRATRLLPEPRNRATADALWRLDRQLVELSGTAAPDGAVRVQPAAVRLVGGARPAPPLAPSDPNDAATILCRFADDTVPRTTVAAIERVMGSTYPGMQQYYGELSLNSSLLANGRVRGWFTLPSPRSRYVSGSFIDTPALLQDCIAAADTSFFFPNYRIINLQFNGPLDTRPVSPFDTLSHGGSWTMALDGAPAYQFGVTWLSSNHSANYVVYAHEMGHAFGWPHSSGTYGSDYDSRWDVMSLGYLRNEAPYGWLTIHTIAPHKAAAGWIPAARRWRPAFGRVEQGVLVRSALPPDNGYLSLEVGLPDAWTLFAEARLVAGHDQPLPAEAVVLHRVAGRRAWVVDVDGNGNPNDAAATWTAGETYADSTGLLRIHVDSAVTDGFALTVRRGFMVHLQVSGLGRVTADTGGIDCRTACVSEPFDSSGAMVTLTAVPDSGQLMGGWTGACFGSGECRLAMTEVRRVGVVFASPVVIGGIAGAGVMGMAYSDTLRASGGANHWRVTSGALPPGLTLDTVLGVLAGVPARSGVFSFTVEARSPYASATRPFTIVVAKPALAAVDVMDMLLGERASLTEDQIRFLDLLGNRNGRLDIGDVRAWLRDSGALRGQRP